MWNGDGRQSEWKGGNGCGMEGTLKEMGFYARSPKFLTFETAFSLKTAQNRVMLRMASNRSKPASLIPFFGVVMGHMSYKSQNRIYIC